MMMERRESAALMNSLTAGVVPRIGLRHIAVGRQKEVEAFLQDLKTIETGGAAFRFVCGSYGSGKSFLLQMIRNHALERSFVVMDADLSPERRLVGTKGQGLTTYRELMQHLSVENRMDGGALEAVLQKWLTCLQREVSQENRDIEEENLLIEKVSERIFKDLQKLTEMAYGFAFSRVLDAYWKGLQTGDEWLKQAALRWLRGEYSTKTEAKKELPVDCMIDDQNWYEFLKLFAKFVSLAGYQGLLIFLDEGVNLYKISNTQARESNYEKVLTIFNDAMQGKAHHLGVFMSGTPQFIYDERRGLFSYEALRSRLSDHQFQFPGLEDFTRPVIRLKTLSKEELYVLLERLLDVHAAHFSYESALTSRELIAFLSLMYKRVGADEMLTPREVTREFLGMLNILNQNENVKFEELLELRNKGFHCEKNRVSDKQENITQEQETNPKKEGKESVFSDFEI